MYKKVIWSIAVLVVLLLGVLTGSAPASASSLRPFTTNGQSTISYTGATYTSYGGFAQFYLHPITFNSGFCDNTHPCTIFVYIDLNDTSTGAYTYAGVESDYGRAGYCGSSGQDEYFVYFDDVNTTAHCKQLASGVNYLKVETNNYVSGGGGIQYSAVDNNNTTYCSFSTCSSADADGTWDEQIFGSYYQGSVDDSTVKMSPTTDVQPNLYKNSSGNYVYYTSANYSISGGNPPFTGWSSGKRPQDPNSAGGQWNICVAGTNVC